MRPVPYVADGTERRDGAAPGEDSRNKLRIALVVARRVEAFVRDVIVPYERDSRLGPHGPSDSLVLELRDKARNAGLIAPHILSDGSHLPQRGVALVLRAAGLSPLGPVALNVGAPDEGNMFLLDRVGTAQQKSQFLQPLIEGRVRSTFLMTEPAELGGAGSDPSMLQTVAERRGEKWSISGHKTYATGASGAGMGLVMAKTGSAATMFLIKLPDPAVRIVRLLDTIDSSMPGGHAVIHIDQLEVTDAEVLGQVNEGFRNAQVRLAPARLTHCMRWLGAVTRCQEIAARYALFRTGFGKPLIDHEGVGFMLAENMIDLQQAELMINWCAEILDGGAPGILESSMTKVAVSEALFRSIDRCVQVMGGSGVSRDTIVEQVFREIRAFRIYDGPTEVHKWSIAKSIKKNILAGVPGRSVS
jgi:acyl-CoA dehydrogenase